VSHLLFDYIDYIFGGIKKMNIICQVKNKEEIEELETIVKVFIVSSRIKQLADTI
jgi:hypothetical protein